MLMELRLHPVGGASRPRLLVLRALAVYGAPIGTGGFTVTSIGVTES
jgi:hypothetical protein